LMNGGGQNLGAADCLAALTDQATGAS